MDLSESFKTVEHSFSGTPAQKSEATVVNFAFPSRIDFLPKKILNDFPQLNGIIIWNCETFTIVKNGFFTDDFGAIQYLYLDFNKIETVEANAFQHLPKLKWISLGGNQLSSLPHKIFRNNPELIAIWLYGNKINSITPDFFKNLDKLQLVSFHSNQCINKIFGCTTGSCSVSESELDSGFSSCYSNCLNDRECASKSGKLDNLSPAEIEKNLDLIIASGHSSALIEKGYQDRLIEKGNKDSIIETDRSLKTAFEVIEKYRNESLESDASLLEGISKNSEEIKKSVEKCEEVSEKLEVQQKSLGNNLNSLIADNEKISAKFQENEALFDGRLNRAVQEVEEKSQKSAESCEKVKLELVESTQKTINLFKENTTKALEATKEEVKDLTKTLVLQMENERLQFKLAEAKHIIEKQALESELKTLKQEVVELKTELKENKENFEQKISEILQKKFDDFTRKLMEDNRP
jgi:Leucine-rich repeat (LRR) protein